MTLLAIFAVFVGPISAWLAFTFFRDGDYRSSGKAVAVAMVSAFIYLSVQDGQNVKIMTEGCYREWDGRSNRMVCDD